MVRIRLRRVGARHQPSYRIVAAEKESPRDGRFLEILGHYNPRTEPSTVEIDEARLFHWLEHGAQPSDAVVKILKPLGTWDRWDRYKAGEPLETLIVEAKAAMPKVDPRTRRDDLIQERRAKKPSAQKEKVPAKPTPEVEATLEKEASEDDLPEEFPEEVVEVEATEGVPTEEPTEDIAAEGKSEEAPEEEAVEEVSTGEPAEDTAAEGEPEEAAEEEAVEEVATEEPSEEPDTEITPEESLEIEASKESAGEEVNEDEAAGDVEVEASEEEDTSEATTSYAETD